MNFRYWVALVFALSGCSTWNVRDSVRPCVAADVVTTVVGVRAGLMREANPLWRASVNAGHYLPFVLASVGLVLLVEWLDDERVSAATAAVECGLAARNLVIMH